MKTIICWLLYNLRFPAFFGAIALFFIVANYIDSAPNLLTTCLIVDIIASIFAMIYAFKNYDEIISFVDVVSYSNIGFFQSQVGFALKVLFQFFFAFWLPAGILLWLFY